MFMVTLPLGMLQTNCYLVSTDGQHLFIIDPADESERIIAAVNESGMEVSGIILTHTHFDHILLPVILPPITARSRSMCTKMSVPSWERAGSLTSCRT